MKVVKIYSMIYDSQKYGDNGYGKYLGEFKKVKQLREDFYVDDFIGVNTETNELCVVLSKEVCGYGGGIAYEVVPIPEVFEYFEERIVDMFNDALNRIFLIDKIKVVDEDGCVVAESDCDDESKNIEAWKAAGFQEDDFYK